MIDKETIYVTKVFYVYDGELYLAPLYVLDSEEAALKQVQNDLKKYPSNSYGVGGRCVDVYDKQYGEDLWDHINTLIVE